MMHECHWKTLLCEHNFPESIAVILCWEQTQGLRVQLWAAEDCFFSSTFSEPHTQREVVSEMHPGRCSCPLSFRLLKPLALHPKKSHYFEQSCSFCCDDSAERFMLIRIRKFNCESDSLSSSIWIHVDFTSETLHTVMSYCRNICAISINRSINLYL